MNVNDGLHNLQQAEGVSDVSQISSVSEVQRKQPSPSQVGTARDHAEVSTAANLAHQAMSVSDVRMDKVVALQQVLGSGNYSVSADDVAAKIVDHMLGR
jgi:anti-sigma28 factor (negative regulator of flagellin synthesis)